VKRPVQTLLATAVTAAFATGPACSQTGSGANPGASGAAAGSPGTTANPAGRAGITDMRDSGAQIARTDRDFVKDVALAGMAEVESSRLAVQKASSPAVKQFAQKMIDDHTAANAELTKLAQSKGAAPPAELDRSQGEGRH
jgi:putative membrane protein